MTTIFKTIYNSTLLSFTNLQFTIDSMTIKKINLVKDTFLSMVRTQFLSHIHMYIAYVRLSLSLIISVLTKAHRWQNHACSDCGP